MPPMEWMCGSCDLAPLRLLHPCHCCPRQTMPASPLPRLSAHARLDEVRGLAVAVLEVKALAGADGVAVDDHPEHLAAAAGVEQGRGRGGGSSCQEEGQWKGRGGRPGQQRGRCQAACRRGGSAPSATAAGVLAQPLQAALPGARPQPDGLPLCVGAELDLGAPHHHVAPLQQRRRRKRGCSTASTDAERT